MASLNNIFQLMKLLLICVYFSNSLFVNSQSVKMSTKVKDLMTHMLDLKNDPKRHDKRTAAFEMYYYSKFGRFANEGRQGALKKALSRIQNSKNAQKELANIIAAGQSEMISTGSNALSNAAMGYAANYAVAYGVVQSTVSTGIKQGGRRAAIIVAEETASLAVGRGAHAALNGIATTGVLTSVGPNIGAAIGQGIGDAIASGLNVENYHAKNSLGAGGSIAGGAVAGAIVGGPIGAGAGAALGAVSWGIGKSISAITNTRLGIKGPNDNWCYVKTGNVSGKVSIGTYTASDTMYWSTYWNEYRGSDCKEFVMSAGQSTNGSFQVSIWDRNDKSVADFKYVYYRDFVWVHDGHAIHCKGELHGKDAGKCVVVKFR